MTKSRSGQEQSDHQRKQNKNLNQSVISITVLFILMSIPQTLVNIYYGDLVELDYGSFLIILGDCIDNTYHASSFIILLLSNKKFLQETKTFFSKNKNNNNFSMAITAITSR